MDQDRLTGTAKDVAGKIEGGVGEMLGDKSTQASGRAREAAGVVQNMYGQAKDAAREAGDAAMDFAKDKFGNGSETLRDGTQALTKRVQDNPMGALLVAGGIGFLLAMLMRSPSRPQPPQRWRY
ncbi:CsbD family protein [Bradyrhizobium sp. HKCCYLRH2060]|uniref:CsbD family protein n=1 Tax=Bradyrhizobium TaxID=374 RepID=UPI0028E49FC6|nr:MULTISPECIES: CsbD family protein [unclassified Bradyrhizobium]